MLWIFLLALSAIPLISFVLSFFFNKIAEYLEHKGPFWLGAALVIVLINVITAKLALLPVIFFPSFDNILAIFVESWQLVLKCIVYIQVTKVGDKMFKFISVKITVV